MARRKTKSMTEMIEKIKNEKIRAGLMIVHFHMKELLFIVLLLVIVVKKEWLQKIPYIGHIFQTEQLQKGLNNDVKKK